MTKSVQDRYYTFKAVFPPLSVCQPPPRPGRERLVPDPPEGMYLRDGETFLPDMSSYFPRDFDMDRWTGSRAHPPT